MAYTDCAGTEHQFGTCVGFSYPPYVPAQFCSNSTLAGVKCLGNVEQFFILTCTYMYEQVFVTIHIAHSEFFQLL